VPRLMTGLEVLWILTAAEDPPLRKARSQSKKQYYLLLWGTLLGAVLGGALILGMRSDMSWYNGVIPFKKQRLTTGS
jgi:hypothetical protein